MIKQIKNRFTHINCGLNDQIIVDNETGIEYYKNGSHFIPLLESDGKPKLNREWIREHS